TYEGVATSWEAKFGWENWAHHLGHTDPSGLSRYYATGVLVPDFPGFKIERVAELYREIGIPYEVLEGPELAAKFPALDVGKFYPPKALSDEGFWVEPTEQVGGFWTHEGGFVDDPQLAAHNLCTAAAFFGANCRFGVGVSRVRRSNERVLGVSLTDGS